MTSSKGSLKTGRGLVASESSFSVFINLYLHPLFTNRSFLVNRLQFEARNQKKEAKEMAVIEAMKKREQKEQGEAPAQTAH